MSINHVGMIVIVRFGKPNPMLRTTLVNNTESKNKRVNLISENHIESIEVPMNI